MQSTQHIDTQIFNKYGWHLQWPRVWITFLGIILFCLGLNIIGMEIGHTVFDSYRSTAFAGFIVFIPLMICTIFIFITACLPKLLLLRIATILCLCMIFLCTLLIIYDVFVLIDPSRCFFLNCANANVNYLENSTFHISLTGWPLTIMWPDNFRNSMNTKRFFQSVQLFSACLSILCCSVYISIYFIYRHLNLHRSLIYESPKLTTTSIYTPYAYPEKCLVSNYDIMYNHVALTQEIEIRKDVLSRMTSVNSNRICRRCMKQPRMSLTNDYNPRTLFSYICTNCNNELMNTQRKSPIIYRITIPKYTSC
ncbi:hypothetical protein I4U23_013353 [Adineta vaga]|nr:hypothetical protein I4U23_013353 [Adineta vaga]